MPFGDSAFGVLALPECNAPPLVSGLNSPGVFSTPLSAGLVGRDRRVPLLNRYRILEGEASPEPH